MDKQIFSIFRKVSTIKMKQIFLLFTLLFSNPLLAQDSDGMMTAKEILDAAHQNDEYPTPCASKVFADALDENRDDISISDSEDAVRAWAETVMFDTDVLQDILECPEIKSAPETKTIIFTPIIFEFEGGERTITINYSTQPKMLKQKLLLATKRSLPDGNPNPHLMDNDDPAIYINTDPAWYAIMVVEHGTLSQFVGEKKNNTLSMKWINDNIDTIYPRGFACTSKSAIANDNFTINKVVRQVVDLGDNDPNDYYVAGDVNLEWIMYAEIALDLAITALTAGGGEAAMIWAKGVRATRTAKNLSTNIKRLSKLEDVVKYIDKAHEVTRHSNDIKKIQKYEKNLKKFEKAKKAGRDTTKYEKEMQETLNAAQRTNPSITAESLKNPDTIKDLEKTLNTKIKEGEETLKEMEKASDNVKQYKKSAETFGDVIKYKNQLRAYKRIWRPKTGNVVTRNLKRVKAAAKTLKAANNGAKMMNRAQRVARAGMSSRTAKINYWLTDKTLKHGASIARFERDVGALYGAVAFVADLYDKTSSTSVEYSNGIEFKPLCLLSADDLNGQENEVNYGMWLMWEGNSTDTTDDDAAFLQSMDFAEKFNYVLNEYQDEHGKNCNVDIYVVRPIIRLDESDPDNTKGELFYLFMNDEPWTTAE